MDTILSVAILLIEILGFGLGAVVRSTGSTSRSAP
jgi:hypothetical protein